MSPLRLNELEGCSPFTEKEVAAALIRFPLVYFPFSTGQITSTRQRSSERVFTLRKTQLSMTDSQTTGQDALPRIDIKPLLTKLWPSTAEVTPAEIANAISHFFTNQVTDVQAASLLMSLHFTRLDFRADVLAACAKALRDAAAPIPVAELHEVIARRGRKEGSYQGGLVRTLNSYADASSCLAS